MFNRGVGGVGLRALTCHKNTATWNVVESSWQSLSMSPERMHLIAPCWGTPGNLSERHPSSKYWQACSHIMLEVLFVPVE